MSPDPSFPSPPLPPEILPTPIVTSKFDRTLANSLYKCSNMGQLTNYHYACLNYPVKSTLTKAINRGYFKVWRGLTSQRTCCRISVSTESKMRHMDQQRQGVQSTQPTPTTVPLQAPGIFDDPMEDVPQEPHNTRTHFVFMGQPLHQSDRPLPYNIKPRPCICCSILHL
jgi:hypothetical protein